MTENLEVSQLGLLQLFRHIDWTMFLLSESVCCMIWCQTICTC